MAVMQRIRSALKLMVAVVAVFLVYLPLERSRSGGLVTYFSKSFLGASSTSSLSTAADARSDAPVATTVPPATPWTGTAAVTYVMRDDHARMAVALMQSMRDFNTRIPVLLVLVGASVHGGAECELKRMAEGLGDNYCTRDEAPPEDLISHVYIRALRAMEVVVRRAASVARTPYSADIAGGPYKFWGSALNKIQVLALTEYRVVLWMDSDTLALQNLDHLITDSPVGPDAFTAAFTVNCCANVRGKVGGSLWVFQPSHRLYQQVWNMSNTPCPVAADPSRGTWHEGDQQIVSFVIAQPTWDKMGWIETHPWLEDYRQGAQPGLHYLVPYRNYGPDDWRGFFGWEIPRRFPNALYGHPDSSPFPHFSFNYSQHQGLLPRDAWPSIPPPGTPLWHPLDVRYDIMVGSCDCKSDFDLAGRAEQDSVGIQMTAHYSCLQPPLTKPGHYSSEAAFMSALVDAPSCIRWYFLTWYEAYTRALGAPGVWTEEEGEYAGLPGPKWEGVKIPKVGPVPKAELAPTGNASTTRRLLRRTSAEGPPPSHHAAAYWAHREAQVEEMVQLEHWAAVRGG